MSNKNKNKMENVKISFIEQLYPNSKSSNVSEIIKSDNKYLLFGGQMFFDDLGIYVMTREQLTEQTERLYLSRFKQSESPQKDQNFYPLVSSLVWGSIALFSGLFWAYIFAKVFGF